MSEDRTDGSATESTDEGSTAGAGAPEKGWSEYADVLDLDHLRERFPGYRDQIVHTRTQPAEEAERVPAADVLPADLADGLGHDLYSHQAEAVERLRDGENVVVSTATASGKTLVYALYFALRKRADPDARALFCYPTKALSRDQQQALNDVFDDLGLDVAVEVYDGDTPGDRRRAIREGADVVITNFAGINVYLPHHPKWRAAFANCELVAIDEAHAYTGIHGMHVAWTLRRLRRVLAYYGSDPQLVCTSATIGNPAEHARRLTGEPHAVVDEDGSPHGRRELAFWDPPLEDDLDEQYDMDEFLGAKQRAGSAAAELAAHLGLHDVQTLGFTRSRQGTELAAKTAERVARDHPVRGSFDVEPYHAGHGKRRRRGTENRLQSGDLDAVLSTSALELGIDVGSVDATVLAGYPGSRQSFWQRVGRSGRGTDDALSVLVGRADAIDQYVLDHPEFLFEEDVEDAVLDLDNDAVYSRHLLCAAEELPLDAGSTDAESADDGGGDDSGGDERWFGAAALPAVDRSSAHEDRLERAVAMWRDAGLLVGDLGRGVQYDGPPRPQAEVSMYATAGEAFQVRCREADEGSSSSPRSPQTREDGEIDMEPIDRSRAYREFHPGALVLHAGTEYEVVEFEEDAAQPSVTLQRVSTNEYTRTHSEKQVADLLERRSRDLGDGYRLCFGMGTVSIHYSEYERREVQTGELVQPPQPTGLPPIELRTQLTWIEVPETLRSQVLAGIPEADLLSDPSELSLGEREYTFAGGLHGAEHAMIKLAPLELRLDSSDMGGLSVPIHPETGVPTWFIHDAVEGGIGYAKGIYEHADALVERTREHVAACDCDGVNGCPACLMDVQCGNRNEPLHSPATVAILEAVGARLRGPEEGAQSSSSSSSASSSR